MTMESSLFMAASLLGFRQGQHDAIERGIDLDLARQPAGRAPLGRGAFQHFQFVASGAGSLSAQASST